MDIVVINSYVHAPGPDTWSANNAQISAFDTFHVGGYKMESGALTTDSSPNGNNNVLTNSGGVAESATGKSGNCGEWDHTAKALLKTSGVSDFSFGSGEFMLSGWINTDNAGDFNAICNTNHSITGTAKSWTVFQTNTGTIFFEINNALQSIATTSTVSAGTYFHWAVTKVANRYDIYFNGTSEANMTNATTLQTPTQFAIGTFYPDAPGTHDMDGEHDEINLWKGMTFTSQAEATNVVSALYNGGTGSFQL